MNDQPQETSPDGRERYEEFLLKEYDNIAQAHFNTVETISTFFKHYLLIVSLPIPILALAFKIGGTPDLAKLMGNTLVAVPIMGALIGLTGLCVMAYVVNLRFDAILYARTVNGVRKYFYERSGCKLNEEMRFRVLPRSVSVPRYWEPRYFVAVVLAFAFLDSAYLSAAVYLYIFFSEATVNWWWAPVVIGVAFAAVHLAGYYALAKWRETGYLRSHIIGLDIDGVLNCHRRHFCQLLCELRRKDIDPDRITRIPVHECEGLDVTEEDEHAVFNEPRYWTEMPAMDGAADIVRRLRNVFGYSIHIFTHRPWPHPPTFPQDRRQELAAAWGEVHRRWRKQPNAIKRITKQWLKKHGFPYDKLTVEQGNIHATDPGVRTNNRFVVSRRKQIRIFVEDDLFKARKLADICEIVFLLDHPYNQANEDQLPNNVVRVKDWKVVYAYIREHL